MKRKNSIEKMPAWAGMLMEHFDAKFNLLIDGYAALDKKIDDLRVEMYQKIDGLRDELRAEIGVLRAEMNARLDQHDAQFEVVFEELHNIRMDIKELRNDVNTLKASVGI